jgi:hypothetical protein
MYFFLHGSLAPLWKLVFQRCSIDIGVPVTKLILTDKGFRSSIV